MSVALVLQHLVGGLLLIRVHGLVERPERRQHLGLAIGPEHPPFIPATGRYKWLIRGPAWLHIWPAYGSFGTEAIGFDGAPGHAHIQGDSAPTRRDGDARMITLYIRYTLDPNKLRDFETYAKALSTPIERCGGVPAGYYLPTKFAGPVNAAVGLIDFPSLAAY